MFGGFIAPYVTRWLGSVARARRAIAYTGAIGACLFLLLHTVIRDPFWAMFAMGMASFGNDILMPGSWGACMDVGGKYAGTLSGSMNMMGNFGGALGPVVLGYVLQKTGSWILNFYIMGGIYLVAALAWRFIDPVTPLKGASLDE
jgi:ACS family glucarate transporter-like MFS transporter